MEKNWRLHLLLRFCRCLSLALALSIACIGVIDVEAATTTKTYSMVYKDEALSQTNLNTILNTDYFLEGDSSLMMGFNFCQTYQILTPDTNVYGYKITVTPSNLSITKTDVIWARPYVGTYSDTVGGRAKIGKELFTGTTSSNDFFFETNGSNEPIFLSYLIKFTEGTKYASFNCTSGTWTVTITSYSKSTWESEVKQELSDQTDELKEQTEEMKEQTDELKEQTEEMKEQTEEMKEQTETQKGMLNKITDFFGSFFQNLIDSVIGLFVPSKEDLSEIFNRFDSFFSSKFGFLYFPFEVLGDFLNIFGSAPPLPELTFPGFSIMGHEVWKPQTYALVENTLLLQISNYVRMGTSAIIIFAFINFCSNKFKGVVSK